LDFVIPRGADGAAGSQGPQGPAATITVGSTTTGAAGTNASVVNSGTSSAAIFDFVIPRGADGAAGPQGPAGTVDWTTSPIICGQKHISAATGWVSVSFGRTFSQPPIVCATLNTGSSQTATPTFIKVANISTTGFNVAIGSANGYGTGDVEWIAIDINRV
jgi:hypothetical protein